MVILVKLLEKISKEIVTKELVDDTRSVILIRLLTLPVSETGVCPSLSFCNLFNIFNIFIL